MAAQKGQKKQVQPVVQNKSKKGSKKKK